MEYHVFWLLKISCFEFFGDGKYGLLFGQKVDGNMVFTDYWKVLVLSFTKIKNTIVFFEPNSWWDYDNCWLLKIFCFELFRDGKHGRFLSQKVHGKMIFTGYWKVFVLNFSMTGNTVFLSEKKFMERCYLIYLLFLSFPWYSRTWEICFFVQCETLAGS